ncbi:MAG: hypothetical protein CW346_12490 [Bacillaceae bacterium]|nr:hypothetical protein [Bacillaceae bacterium]
MLAIRKKFHAGKSDRRDKRDIGYSNRRPWALFFRRAVCPYPGTGRMKLGAKESFPAETAVFRETDGENRPCGRLPA